MCVIARGPGLGWTARLRLDADPSRIAASASLPRGDNSLRATTDEAPTSDFLGEQKYIEAPMESTGSELRVLGRMHAGRVGEKLGAVRTAALTITSRYPARGAEMGWLLQNPCCVIEKKQYASSTVRGYGP